MSQELIKSIESSLKLKSLADLVKSDEDVMLLLDTSGSMAGQPIVVLRKVVNEIKTVGAVPMIAFGGPYDCQVRFVDAVPDPDGGTPLHAAIALAHEYGATRLVVISDGLPDLKQQCLDEAKQFGGRIDVVFCGSEGDAGAFFLEELAKLTGGTRLVRDFGDAKSLTSAVIGLLDGEVEERAPLQGPGFTSSEAVEPDEDDVDDEDEDDDADDDDEDDDA